MLPQTISFHLINPYTLLWSVQFYKLIMCLNWYHKWFTWDHWQRLSWFPQSHRERWSKWITVPINFILKPHHKTVIPHEKEKRKKHRSLCFPIAFQFGLLEDLAQFLPNEDPFSLSSCHCTLCSALRTITATN